MQKNIKFFFITFYLAHLSSSLQFPVAFAYPKAHYPLIICSIASIFSLFRPLSFISLLLIFLSSSFRFIFYLPEIPNHLILLQTITFFIFIHSLILLYRKENFHLAIKETRPLLLYLAMCLYFFAGFAKLNTNYLNTETSCSSLFIDNINSFISFFPNFKLFKKLSIFSSIFIELSIPLLIFFRKTRLIGVILGLFFHAILALDPIKLFTNFSMTMCFILTNIIKLNFNNFNFYFLQMWSKFYGLTLLSLTLFCASNKLAPEILAKFQCINISLLIFIFLIKIFKSDKEIPFLRLNKLSFTLTLISILNGITVYIGLKNGSSFSMYSNLLVRKDYSNHLLIKKNIDILKLSYPLHTVSINNNDFVELPFFEILRLTQNNKVKSLKIKEGYEIKTLSLNNFSNKDTKFDFLKTFFYFRDMKKKTNCNW